MADPQTIPLIPRQVLFGNPDKASPRLSPDGTLLSFLAPVDGVLNLWVGPSGDVGSARPVTGDRDRGIRVYLWAYTSPATSTAHPSMSRPERSKCRV